MDRAESIARAFMQGEQSRIRLGEAIRLAIEEAEQAEAVGMRERCSRALGDYCMMSEKEFKRKYKFFPDASRHNPHMTIVRSLSIPTQSLHLALARARRNEHEQSCSQCWKNNQPRGFIHSKCDRFDALEAEVARLEQAQREGK